MEYIAEEILREILLRLLTRPWRVCVCRLLHGIVAEPSFQALHSNSLHVLSGSGSDAETLFVPEFRVTENGMGLEMTVVSAGSAKPIGRFIDLPDRYSPVNACNGFLLIASRVTHWPLYVCNPVMGEKLKFPAPPTIKSILWHMYAMGYSPFTREYKLFRISFSQRGWPEIQERQGQYATAVITLS